VKSSRYKTAVSEYQLTESEMLWIAEGGTFPSYPATQTKETGKNMSHVGFLIPVPVYVVMGKVSFT